MASQVVDPGIGCGGFCYDIFPVVIVKKSEFHFQAPQAVPERGGISILKIRNAYIIGMFETQTYLDSVTNMLLSKEKLTGVDGLL